MTAIQVIKNIEDEIAQGQARIRALRSSCEHTWVPSNPSWLSSSTPVCSVCGDAKHGWWCETSPTKECDYKLKKGAATIPTVASIASNLANASEVGKPRVNGRLKMATDFAWVIEKHYGPELSYYAPTAPGEWTRDHLKACRFARKEDAEAVQFRHVTHGYFPVFDTRVCEHGWG